MTRVGIYTGTADESVENIQKQLLAWSSYLDRYQVDLYGSASIPDSVVDEYDIVRTTDRQARNAMTKIRTTYQDTADYLSTRDPDVLVQIWNYPGHAPGLTVAGKRFGVPVVTRFSGDHFHEFRRFSGPNRLFYYFYLNILSQIAVRFADKTIALGPHGVDQLRAHGANENKVIIIPPATGVEPRFHPGEKTTYRRKLDLPQDKIVLVYVGRLSKLKGIEFMRQVITSVDDPNEFLFLLVGDGEYREILDKEFDEKLVRMPGYVPYKDIDKYYKAADGYVHCSPYEGIPLVILEALQCGLPVIARRAGDIDFVLSNVVETPEEMASLIRRRDWNREWKNEEYFSDNYQQAALKKVIADVVSQ